MPVIFQQIIARADARRNAQVLYVFGDNVARKGMGGLAAELRNEKNAVGVRTKYTAHEFYTEDPESVAAQNRMIDEDMKPLFDHVRRGGVVVWPARGVGQGTARLPLRAPSTFDHLERKLEALIEAARLNRPKTAPERQPRRSGPLTFTPPQA